MQDAWGKRKEGRMCRRQPRSPSTSAFTSSILVWSLPPPSSLLPPPTPPSPSFLSPSYPLPDSEKKRAAPVRAPRTFPR